MVIDLNDYEIRKLYREWVDVKEDESTFYALANYLIEELEKQHPEL
jgi:hypothetical protein